MSVRNAFQDDAERDNLLVPLALGILALVRPLRKALDAVPDPVANTIEGDEAPARSAIRYGVLGLLAVSLRVQRLIDRLPDPPVTAREPIMPPGLLR